MKRLVGTCVVVLISSLAILAQTAPDAADLTKMLNDFLAGASKNDAAAHDRFWADDLIYTRSTGIRTTKEEIMKGLRSSTPPKADDPTTTYSAEDVVIHQYGMTAVVAFRLVINAKKKDGSAKVISNLNTGVFLKRKGRWQVVAWQSTVVPEAHTDNRPAMPVPQNKAAKLSQSGDPHMYQKGARGGCYYLNDAGSKVYVDHKYCQ